MRYLKQQDQYSCGPVAIANAMKWYGSKERAKDLRKRFIPICKCMSDIGTHIPYFEEGIVKAKFHLIDRIERPKIKDLDEYLSKGWIAILRVRHEVYGGHLFICTRQTPKMYEVVNYRRRCKTVSKILKSTMKNHLDVVDKCTGSVHYSVAWFIEGKDDEILETKR
jgi:hypothetical protein